MNNTEEYLKAVEEIEFFDKLLASTQDAFLGIDEEYIELVRKQLSNIEELIDNPIFTELEKSLLTTKLNNSIMSYTEEVGLLIDYLGIRDFKFIDIDEEDSADEE